MSIIRLWTSRPEVPHGLGIGKSPLKRRTSWGSALVGTGLLAVGGCDSAALELPELFLATCAGVLEAPGGISLSENDTLEVRVRIADPSPVSLLVRVDSPGEGATVHFPEDHAPGMAAAAAAVNNRGVYRVCVEPNPVRMTLDAESAPHGRAWLRVTTRRPVRAALETGVGSGEVREVGVNVAPGSSGRVGP